MSLATEYPCTAKLVIMLEQSKLSLDALRVFHALHFLIDQDRDASVEAMDNWKIPSPTIRSRFVIGSTFPASVRDLRALGPALAELQERKLLQEWEFLETSRRLKMRFSRVVIQAARRAKNDQFAMIDTAVLRELSSPTQVLFYTRAVMHRRSRFPKFQLPGISSDQPWAAVRRKWLDAAIGMSERLGDQYLFCPSLDYLSGEVRSVAVKVSNQRTQWYPGKLYSRVSEGRFIAVHGGRHQSLTRKDILAREAWTQVGWPGGSAGNAVSGASTDGACVF